MNRRLENACWRSVALKPAARAGSGLRNLCQGPAPRARSSRCRVRNGKQTRHAISPAADDARYESGPPLATNSPMALSSLRSRCKASLADTRRVASLLDDLRASSLSSNAVRGCWTGMARSSIEMSPRSVGSDRPHADSTVMFGPDRSFKSVCRGQIVKPSGRAFAQELHFANTWQWLKMTKTRFSATPPSASGFPCALFSEGGRS
jgi:hypothetical protein